MKFSDVEDNQQMAVPFEDDEPPPPEAKVQDLADMYMMKSPVTLALKRKSVSNQGGQGASVPGVPQIRSSLSLESLGVKIDPIWQKRYPWDTEVDIANKEIFGNAEFRENQREIINATKSGKKVLALIPTGGGKSLTFQLSAVTDQGVTFVVMPLLSLIEDNLQFVEELGIPSCSLSTNGNSQKEERRISELYREIRQLKYKLVYLTPERLVKSPALLGLIDYLASQGSIDRFVIDEVHCVSHWGQDFRKDYLHLDFLKDKYPKVPLLCLTATATIKVKDDITKRLKIDRDYAFFQSSFNRPNLIYEIRDKK